MNTRVAVLLAALAVPAVAAAPARAATVRKACLQVMDATGDGTATNGTVPVEPSHDPIDIVSGDVATGGRNLVAVLRLKSLAADPALAGGTTYTFAWYAAGVGQSVSLVQYTDGTKVATFDPNTATAASNDTRSAGVIVDPATASITWTVARSANPALHKKGVKITGMQATAAPATNLSAAGSFSFSSSLNGDTAATGRTYVDGTPTCVKGV